MLSDKNIIVNRVAQSGIITLDLAQFSPKHEIAEIDLKGFLFKELILKEKDFRLAVKELDLGLYENKYIGVYCSTDAIIPAWAYMLMVCRLNESASAVYPCSGKELHKNLWLENIKQDLQPENYLDKRVVLKGCGDENIPHEAYLLASSLLQKQVKSLMYGEPCSTVPVYKRK